MPLLIALALFFPLAGFLGLMAFEKIVSRGWAGIVACSTIFVSFISFLIVLFIYLKGGMEAQSFTLFTLIPLERIHADFTLRLDSLSLLMALIISGIGFLIHLYSLGYMEREEDLPRYFACLNFFIFCMLLLVWAGHLLVLFIGWEGVGVASYLLIGFWSARPAAAQAATKAFIMNRIGDLAFLLGLILTYTVFGTGDIVEISQRAGEPFMVGAPVMTILTLLYFIGATGKSAQLPLYSWLPDAMEGPTPVSALIHAATMVTAGVYLIVRLHALFLLAPITLQIMGVVGGGTALFAALCALGQTDLKRVLAFSTVSQLGLMFLACGAGAFYSAMFHLTTHAFVKALLFLSAGNVVHMMHGTTEMEKMGGLSTLFRKTDRFFLVGVLALSGIPPFAAFFSKDLILEQEFLAGYETLFYIGLASSLLTGVYMTRAYCLTFRGALRLETDQLKTVKEAPLVMLIPVALLALLAIGGGALGYSFDSQPLLENFLREIGVNPIEEELRSGFLLTPETWLAMGGAFLGVGVTALVYTRYPDRLRAPFPLLKHQFYMNELYDDAFVKPLKAISRGIVHYLEPKVLKGLIKGIVQGVQRVAHQLQQWQTGQIRSYMAWMVIGSAFVLAYVFKELR